MSDSAQVPSPRLLDLRREQLVAACMLLGFALFVVWDQVYWWGEREDYSFGYLVPFFVGYVLFDRWPIIRSYLFSGAKPGEAPPAADAPKPLVGALEGLAGALFIGGAALFVLGGLIRSAIGPQNPASLALSAGFAAILLSTVFLMSRERADGEAMALKSRVSLTLLFLFAALIWLISAPLVSFLEKKVLLFLQDKVTFVVFGLLEFLGYEIIRQGNVLQLPDGDVGVAEACSGIRSLTACLFAGSFLAAVFLDRFWKKFALVACAMVMAVITNLIRSLYLTLTAYHNGSGAIEEHWVLPVVGDIGSVHDVTGFAILGVTSIGLILLLPVFNFKLTPLEDDFDEGGGDDEAEQSSLESDGIQSKREHGKA